MQKIQEGAGGTDDAHVLHGLGLPGQSPETPLGMCRQLRDVIRSADDLLQGPPSPAAFCLSRQ